MQHNTTDEREQGFFFCFLGAESYVSMGSNGGSSSSGFESNIVKNDWWSDWFFGPHFGQNPLESIGSLIFKK